MSDWREVREALLGEMGEPLLRFMRDVFLERAGARADLQVAGFAERLGWVAADPIRGWQLTKEGAFAADSAREYCNWLDDRRALPFGVAEGDVRAKAVLDVGCGFGRHVLSASRMASMAVGLEAEPSFLRMSSILATRERIGSATFVRGYSERMPFAAESFHCVICTRSLQYMDIRRTLSEMSRVMKTGGKFFLTYATFHHLLADFFDGRIADPRRKARTAKHMANTLGTTWLGHKFFTRSGANTTASPVHLLRRSLLRLCGASRLRLLEEIPIPHSGKDSLFVLEKVA